MHPSTVLAIYLQSPFLLAGEYINGWKITYYSLFIYFMTRDFPSTKQNPPSCVIHNCMSVQRKTEMPFVFFLTQVSFTEGECA
jgi:hypothetical protein